MRFKRFDKTWVDWDSKFDIYASLAEELNVTRRAAKILFWSVVYHANDLRLGAAADEINIEDVAAEDGHTYSVTGEFIRPVVSHYIIERFRILNQLDHINYEMPVDS